MVDVPYYEQGHRAGDWMNVEATVSEGKKTAIVHDVADGRYEVWDDGHCVNGAADSLGEARQILAVTLSKKVRRN